MASTLDWEGSSGASSSTNAFIASCSAGQTQLFQLLWLQCFHVTPPHSPLTAAHFPGFLGTNTYSPGFCALCLIFVVPVSSAIQRLGITPRFWPIGGTLFWLPVLRFYSLKTNQKNVKGLLRRKVGTQSVFLLFFFFFLKFLLKDIPPIDF